MMIVSAIAAILFVAASALMVSLTNQKTEARKRIDRLAQGFSALTLVERNLLNTGYHFPSARFAFRVYNNVANGSTIGGMGVGSPCAGTGCIVANTDVVEMAIGHDGPFGIVAAASVDGGGMSVFIRSPGPVQAGDTGQYVFVFGDGAGQSCAAVGSVNATNTVISVQMLNEDFAPVATNYYSNTSPAPRNFQCPAPNMTISATAALHRYFVYMLADGGDIGLYQQRATALPSAANRGYVAGSERVVTLGIDNLQAVPIIAQAGTGFSTQCIGGICRCNALGDCVIDGGNQFDLGNRVDGVELSISVRGDAVQTTAVSTIRQQLGDETWSNDTTVRTVQSQTFMFRNFSQVQQ
ncbi:MAG: hypothetical protein JNG84_14630 [Archangium sp.]|nr:hypothetical protein [Archangium sp.]